MFRVIIAGSRDFDNYELLKTFCDKVLVNQKYVEIVSGKAKGADSLGERYATEKGFRLKEFPADWNKYGKSAGMIRNKQMGEYADALIDFWDGKSRGTKQMIDFAKSKSLKIKICKYKN